MTRLHVVRVFAGSDGAGGNPAAVFLDGADVPAPPRQAVAADLGLSETVFVDDRAAGRLQIFTPQTELGFAGHPLVGTAWVLATEGTAVDVLRPPAGEIPVWQEGGMTWLRARPEWSPQREVRQFADPGEVDALTGADDGAFDLYAWAWIDEPGGVVRVRYFAPGLGIPEDEATGSGAVVLGARLGRAITIVQGRASELSVRPADDGTVAVGGRVVADRTRDYPVAGVAGGAGSPGVAAGGRG